MTKLSEANIEKELKELRKFIESSDATLLETRCAYSIECVVRYITKDTSWKSDGYSLINEAKATATLIQEEIDEGKIK